MLKKSKKKLKKLNPSNKIKRINPDSPDPLLLKEAAEIIREGGVVVFPTKCLYGLAADAMNREAVAKIFKIKGRSPAKPLLVLIKEQKALETIVKDIPVNAQRLMAKFWPGNMTLIFFARQNLPPLLTGNSGKIGVRLPGHPAASALTKLLENPITATSANLSGKSGCSNIGQLDLKILLEVDLVLDAGPLQGGIGSTIVDTTEKRLLILREGTTSSKQVFNSQ